MEAIPTPSKANRANIPASIMYRLYPLVLFAARIIKDYSGINFSSGKAALRIPAGFIALSGMIAVMLACAVRKDVKGTYLAGYFRTRVYEFRTTFLPDFSRISVLQTGTLHFQAYALLPDEKP